MRSDTDRLVIADDGSPGNLKKEDAVRQPHPETSNHRRGSRFDVCEVFSPARVALTAEKSGLRGGWSLDLSQPCTVTGRKWNCLVEADREWARRQVYKDKPELLVVCPPCTLFSSLQNLSPNGLPNVRCPDRWEEALVMLRFAVELCRIQHAAGRVFVFEHPATATSWEDESLRGLLELPGVLLSVMDMCRYGMVSEDKEGVAPVRKTTKIATNVPEIADALSHRCEGGHRHVHLISGRPKNAAIYPSGFCRDLIKGFIMNRNRKNAGVKWSGDIGSFEKQRAAVGSLLNFARSDLCDPEEEELNGRFVDDIKGCELDPVLTRAARKEELDEFKKRQVYDVVPRTEMQRGSKIVGVRWVETDKGTPDVPRVRSRLVAQEFANSADPTGELFAPTPPLAATRWLISGAASRGLQGPGDWRLMLLDFKKAFLYADIERELFIELPDDDSRREGGKNIGRLNKAMYGTRDAPAAWSRLVRTMLSNLGFEPCRTSACVFYHPVKKLKIVSHVDDFLCSGTDKDLVWLRSQLKDKYEVDGDILGCGKDECREGKFLGRLIRYTSAGIEWEADPKQVASLVAEFGLDNCKGADTPGVKSDVDGSDENMNSADASRFRRGAAKLNYLSQDRVDISFASKEISRHMSSPKIGDDVLLKRVVRYLQKHPRLVISYPWQEDATEIVAYTDSDWGGCVKTRRSTSGGTLMRGKHMIIHWSRTQQLIALSSAEAELNAAVKAAQEGLGVAHLEEEFGRWLRVRLLGDSSANHGMIQRQGAGKVKHLTVRQLWLQQQAELGCAIHEKIPRAINCADMLTHYWTKTDAADHLRHLHCYRPEPRTTN